MEKTDENSKDNRNFNHSNFSCDYIPDTIVEIIVSLLGKQIRYKE